MTRGSHDVFVEDNPFKSKGKKNNCISNKQCEKRVSKHVSFEKIMPVSGFVQFRVIGSKKELVAWMNIPLEIKTMGDCLATCTYETASLINIFVWNGSNSHLVELR